MIHISTEFHKPLYLFTLLVQNQPLFFLLSSRFELWLRMENTFLVKGSSSSLADRPRCFHFPRSSCLPLILFLVVIFCFLYLDFPLLPSMWGGLPCHGLIKYRFCRSFGLRIWQLNLLKSEGGYFRLRQLQSLNILLINKSDFS